MDEVKEKTKDKTNGEARKKQKEKKILEEINHKWALQSTPHHLEYLDFYEPKMGPTLHDSQLKPSLPRK